jgi:hypothetical protein
MPSPFHHQIVIYAADPHRLARFWAEAMGYVLEDDSRLIDGVLATGAASERDTTVVDGRRFWSEAVAIGHPDDPVDEATWIIHGRRILFELQVTTKTDENRVHIDINIGPERLAEETARLEALGATLIEERRDLPRATFNRMADPEGNEFCLQ